jgi:hypothetical protein
VLSSYPTVPALVELTSRGGVVSKLVAQAHDALRALNHLGTNDVDKKDDDNTQWLEEYTKAAFCLSVLWSILVVTRGLRFPWWNDLSSPLDTSNPTATSGNALTPSKHSMHILLQLYIDFVTVTIQREQQAPFLIDYDPALCTFVDAIGILVRGTAAAVGGGGAPVDGTTTVQQERNVARLYERLVEWNGQSRAIPRATAMMQCLLEDPWVASSRLTENVPTVNAHITN